MNGQKKAQMCWVGPVQFSSDSELNLREPFVYRMIKNQVPLEWVTLLLYLRTDWGVSWWARACSTKSPSTVHLLSTSQHGSPVLCREWQDKALCKPKQTRACLARCFIKWGSLSEAFILWSAQQLGCPGIVKTGAYHLGITGLSVKIK